MTGESGSFDDLAGLGGPPAPPPAPEAAAPAGAAPPVLEPDEVIPPSAPPRRGPGRPKGSGKRKSGAQYRAEKKARARGAAAPPPAPPPPAAGDGPAPKSAAEERPDDLRYAREVIDDPDTIRWLEGLYRMPFETWASVVHVPEVVPSDPKIERAARLLHKCMALFGPKKWMQYLPFLFLLIAVGEDVAHGYAAVKAHRRRAGEPAEGSRPGPVPAASSGSPENRPAPPFPPLEVPGGPPPPSNGDPPTAAV